MSMKLLQSGKALLQWTLLLAVELWLLLSLYRWVETDLCPQDYQASGHCYAPWFDGFELIYFPLQFSLLLLTALAGFVAVAQRLGLSRPRALGGGLALAISAYAGVFLISNGVLWVAQAVSLTLAFMLAGWLWRRDTAPR